jgi:tetratricopeptide (TPR) repeat protein
LQVFHLAAEASAYGSQVPSIVAIMMNIARIYYKNGQHEEAVPVGTEALDYARHNYKEDTHMLLVVSSLLNCLGVLHFHIPNCDADTAMAFYEESLTIRRAILGENSETKEIATTLNNIGRVYYMKGEHGVALSIYDEALKMRRERFGNNNLDVAATVYNAGQTYHQKGMAAEATYGCVQRVPDPRKRPSR